MRRKQDYFTSSNLDQLTRELIEEYRDKRRQQPLRPGRCALLLLDLQRYFLDPDFHAFIPSAPVLLPGILDLARRFREKEWPVIATQHCNTEANAGGMGRWWQDLLTPDHPGQFLLDEILSLADEVVLKSQYDAFMGTRLLELLSGLQVKQVIITGVMTHLCCESTARSAFSHGYEVFFPVDGSASYTIEHHRATLLNLAHGCAYLCSMKELLGAWEKV